MHVGVAGSVANHSNGTLVASTATGGGYPCCFVTWLVRSKDLSHWEESKNNPMMGWPDWSDHVITPGSLLDTLGTASQKEIGRNLAGKHYSDINRSDQDMVELPPSFVAQLNSSSHASPSVVGPWTYMVFAAADQLTMGFGAGYVAKSSMHGYLSSLF